MTTYTLRKADPTKTRADLVVIGVRQSGDDLTVAPGGEEVAQAYGRKFTPMLRALGFKGSADEVIRIPTSGTIRAAQLLLVGLGDYDALAADNRHRVLRRAAGAAARNLGNAASVAIALPTDDQKLIRAVTEGFVSGTYAYAGGKSKPPEAGVSEVVLLTDSARRPETVATFETAQAVQTLVATARDWVNCPPNDLRPDTFAQAVVELGKARQGRRRKPVVETEVLEVEQLRELGCGGILGVGQGSSCAPRLVRLTYRPKESRATLALVGKGVTFDSGGLTIKPGSSMTTMKMDMAGAATVITAIHAIAEQELPISVTAYAPMVENMPSGSALRPGDVLTTHDGQTVEISNTDAEGRLILADALAMAAETEPDMIIDVATLTGACVVALGERVGGVFGDDASTEAVLAAAEATGELFWRLPIPAQQRDLVRTGSNIADLLQHKWERWGSALFAAAFLEAFTAGRPWAHLDIAGPAWNDGGAWGYEPSGATGMAMRTLVEYAARMAESR